MPAPRDDLIRMSPIVRADDADGNTLVGYPVVFDEWTEINSWEGRFRERIHPGALNKTIKERGGQVKVLFNHGMDPQIGDKPLGKPRVMRADEQGLWTETPLDDTSYNRDIRASLASGALDGMSFRFSVVREEWTRSEDDDMDERTILELRLYEFGPVTFPAYEATTAGIRSREAFALWRATPPNQRRELLAHLPLATDLDPSDAGDASTSERSSDTPPPGHLSAPMRRQTVRRYDLAIRRKQ